MILSDRYFTIGHGHDVCQDYALAAFPGGPPFVAVADGCSGAPEPNLSDLGARLVCLAARALPGDLCAIPHLAFAMALQTGIPESLFSSLTSTLLHIYLKQDAWHAHVYGDGVLVRAKLADRQVVDLDIRLFDSGNQPFYPHYAITHALTSGEMTMVQGDQQERVQVPYSIEWDMSHYNFALVGSDGWASFSDHSATSLLTELVTRVARTAPTPGYLQRCAKHILRRSGFHEDDVSAAALWSFP